ncbi:DUF2187 family protein [Sutcliffiella cohnii]|uniref:DUF2187 domain-containing protein n=1 Tax=Sutcliffiella cohnii TaxID=33932 RepID=A0A223KR49_9BACI|nr:MULTISPECIES: DUF2187 family protein [Sutcliffiella]AST91818.1 DUF2187 domain-containing protein [Sutcliffiella cohnii]MED4018625.1 DUF2187 family protein [Sutcliffiella cohnii]WBL13038.1 DUF2187 family protein [Sutcliffiella sp. NC1]
METENKLTNVANIGDTISVKGGHRKGIKGQVIAVRDSSVIVDIGKNPNTGEPIRTVINHKNYKVTKG